MSKFGIILVCFLLVNIDSAFSWLHWNPWHRYCNRQAFNPYSYICCANQLSSRAGMRTPACCGTVAFDTSTSICCAGKVVARTTTSSGCCGATVIDVATKDCCNGVVIDRSTDICCGATKITRTSIYDRCCGSLRFDSTKQLCCINQVKNVADVFPGATNFPFRRFACCGVNVFDLYSQYCLNGYIYPRRWG